MSAEDFQASLKNIEQDFHQVLEAASTEEDLERLRVEYLGRKGRLAVVMAGLPDLTDSERPSAGKQANLCKKGLLDLLSKKREELQTDVQAGPAAGFDVSLPGRRDWVGSLHPVTLVLDEMCSAFSTIGFDVVTGPEIENDFYNFEALNIPDEHPARDMQDTLYITESIVLRTHTSPLQIRTMESAPPPLAVIAPGKVYRRDADLTHTPMFHQVEGFLVDEQVGMGDLRGTLTHFVHSVFSRKTKVRFRPSYFPFTEPSAEVDISCVICNGSGFCGPDPCRVCKQTGWVEILGCGMIDPAVFEKVGYDPEHWTGFAFGIGVERVAMLKYFIDDLRLFFENDTRFLGQFQQL